MAGGKLVLCALILLILIAAAALAFPLARAFVVLPLVLFLPGAVMARVFLPERKIDFEFVVFSAGLSLAAVIVFALMLNLFQAVNAAGWGAAAFALIFVAIVALLRSTRVRRAARYVNLSHFALKRAGAIIIGFVVAASLVVSAIALAHYGASRHLQFKYTEFWIVPSQAGDQLVTIGVRNKEQKASTYDVEVLVDQRLLARWDDIDLADDDPWIKQVPIPLKLDPNHRIEARLYNHDEPLQIYRNVWISASNLTE